MSTEGLKYSAGAKYYIAVPGPLSPAPSWQLVGEITNMGEFGRQYEKIIHQSLNRRGALKKKGGYDEGDFSFELAWKDDDDGQAMMLEAANADDDYNHKIELDDADGSPATPTKFIFQGPVFSFRRTIGDVNSLINATAEVGIQADSWTETPRGSLA